MSSWQWKHCFSNLGASAPVPSWHRLHSNCAMSARPRSGSAWPAGWVAAGDAAEAESRAVGELDAEVGSAEPAVGFGSLVEQAAARRLSVAKAQRTGRPMGPMVEE